MDIQTSRLTIQILFLTIQMLFLITQTGCKQPIENPELADPVFLDLVAETNAAKAQIAAELKSISETKTKIADLPPRDATRNGLTRELGIHERNLAIARQNRAYFEIRAQQRKEFVLLAYQKAFDADLPWPNPEEATEYKKMKALKSASRNWEDRVPKTTRYNRQPTVSEAKEAPKGEGSSGGGQH